VSIVGAEVEQGLAPCGGRDFAEHNLAGCRASWTLWHRQLDVPPPPS